MVAKTGEVERDRCPGRVYDGVALGMIAPLLLLFSLVRPMTRIFLVLLMFSVIADAESSADPGVKAVGQQGVEAMFRAEAPYIAKARASYPQAKSRYLAGLPAGYSFVVRKHLTEPGTHKSDGVLIEVDSIKNGKIYGRIGEVDLPSFHRGQRISFPESELEDWVIRHPNGSHEGDFIGKFVENARSAYTNDLALSQGDIANIKRISYRFIGIPFRDASHWMELAPYIRTESELYQPMTTCAGEYCSGGLRLRDDAEFLYSYLHIPPNGNKHDNGDITPDLGRKGNNRFVGVALITHGKTILSEGHLDRNTIDLYLQHRDSRKAK
jgi:hypothetical protein